MADLCVDLGVGRCALTGMRAWTGIARPWSPDQLPISTAAGLGRLAVAESFFSTLKLDLLYRHNWPTRAAARSAIFEYTEGFYNRERRHTTLGNLSPADYESQHAAACSA